MKSFLKSPGRMFPFSADGKNGSFFVKTEKIGLIFSGDILS